ncbi:MAG TPA: farnesyl diphosphate synthase [Thermoanaerobaculia bacterium]|nr:farnesyl diphosphate synthase [Thermoanaerobaculia bacterium]
MSTLPGLQEQLELWRSWVDATLEAELPAESTRPEAIHRAMRWAVLGGGKRLRPILAIAAASACGADPRPLLRPICALELIHTYSLVHDDLPALDDDELRRGRKTTHVVFGEALGILAGDALLTEAFCWLTEPVDSVPAERQLRAVRRVARAIDSTGMIGGQVADLEAERIQQKTGDRAMLLETLEFIHRNKTGRLLTASVELGGILAGAAETALSHLRGYGEALGLAFQIVDDLLDVEQTSEALGKTAGKDAAQGKLTYPSLVGAEEARQRADALLETACRSAAMIVGPGNYLPQMARYIGARRT